MIPMKDSRAVARSAADQVPTTASIHKTVDLNLDIDEPDVVQAAEIAGRPSNNADAKNVERDDQTTAGHRWGEGLDSVIAQMSASAKRKKGRALQFSGPQ